MRHAVAQIVPYACVVAVVGERGSIGDSLTTDRYVVREGYDDLVVGGGSARGWVG